MSARFFISCGLFRFMRPRQSRRRNSPLRFLGDKMKFTELLKITDFSGRESGGILLKSGEIIEIENVSSDDNKFICDRQSYQVLRSKYNGNVDAIIHSHPLSDAKPSNEDIYIANKYRIRKGERRAIWHPRSGQVVFFNEKGETSRTPVSCPFWFRLLSLFFFSGHGYD